MSWSSPNFGTELCFNVLYETGKVVPVSTLRSLTSSEKASQSIKKRIEKLDKFIHERYGSPRHSPEEPVTSDLQLNKLEEEEVNEYYRKESIYN